MPATQILFNKNLHDINPILAGWASISAGGTNPPRLRDHALLHYIKSGRGVLHSPMGDFPVHAGQAFFIPLNELSSYQADENDPWTYSWVGFTGSLIEEFAALPRVFDAGEDLLPYLRQLDSTSDSMAYDLASDLFRIYARLVNQEQGSRNYIHAVKEYIENNYMHKISVEDIAATQNLDRRYLSQLFKKKTGYTIQGYILETRLRAAKQYLTQGHSVSDAATFSGFNDISNFSKIFLREEDVSPLAWKKQVQASLANAHEKTTP